MVLGPDPGSDPDPRKESAVPNLLEAVMSDGALLFFSAAGLVATAIAILRDARTQRDDLAREAVRLES
jgi:hypothetical protein